MMRDERGFGVLAETDSQCDVVLSYLRLSYVATHTLFD